MATRLSGYRILWIMVMFDLPTDTRDQRRAATRFRNFLLDEGFERSQFSVYVRFVSGRPAYETRVRRIREALPSAGEVHVLAFTDKQYASAVRFSCRARRPPPDDSEQLVLF